MTHPRAAYNEIDPKAAAWLRELIRQGHIAPGDVIEASIEDLTPNDLKPYTQVHFFAGIGVWSYALRGAGWSDDRPVWTGSCPCQPFSAAGKGEGFDDERHLWPAFHYLIDQCRPDIVFGEQVASKDGLGWLDLVQADLEGTGYASGAVDLCAAGVGAPHIRQRLWWFGERLADDDRFRQHSVTERPFLHAEHHAKPRSGLIGLDNGDGARPPEDAGNPGQVSGVPQAQRQSKHSPSLSGRGGRSIGLEHCQGDRWLERRPEPGGRGVACGCGDGGLADADSGQRDGLAELRGAERNGPDAGRAKGGGEPGAHGDDAGLLSRPAGHVSHGARAKGEYGLREVALRSSTVDRIRDPADWLYGRDGVWRPVEPGTFPLAHGAPARVGRLRGYGNAINAEAAAAFIQSYLEAVGDYSDAA